MNVNPSSIIISLPLELICIQTLLTKLTGLTSLWRHTIQQDVDILHSIITGTDTIGGTTSGADLKEPNLPIHNTHNISSITSTNSTHSSSIQFISSNTDTNTNTNTPILDRERKASIDINRFRSAVMYRLTRKRIIQVNRERLLALEGVIKALICGDTAVTTYVRIYTIYYVKYITLRL